MRTSRTNKKHAPTSLQKSKWSWLNERLGFEAPEYVHVGVLRNPDGSKISKRKNPVSIDYYKDAGILPQALLKSLAGPFPQARFCPTGGLHPGNFRDYLAQANVICCGGSWMVGADLVNNGRWEEIEALARAAMADTPLT